jgi:hypothetical protein
MFSMFGVFVMNTRKNVFTIFSKTVSLHEVTAEPLKRISYSVRACVSFQTGR